MQLQRTWKPGKITSKQYSYWYLYSRRTVAHVSVLFHNAMKKLGRCLYLLGAEVNQRLLNCSPALCTGPGLSGSHWGSRHVHVANNSRPAQQLIAPYWNPELLKLCQPTMPLLGELGDHPSIPPRYSRLHCQSPWLALEAREKGRRKSSQGISRAFNSFQWWNYYITKASILDNIKNQTE